MPLLRGGKLDVKILICIRSLGRAGIPVASGRHNPAADAGLTGGGMQLFTSLTCGSADRSGVPGFRNTPPILTEWYNYMMIMGSFR